MDIHQKWPKVQGMHPALKFFSFVWLLDRTSMTKFPGVGSGESFFESFKSILSIQTILFYLFKSIQKLVSLLYRKNRIRRLRKDMKRPGKNKPFEIQFFYTITKATTRNRAKICMAHRTLLCCRLRFWNRRFFYTKF